MFLKTILWVLRISAVNRNLAPLQAFCEAIINQ